MFSGGGPVITNVRDLIRFHESLRLQAYWDPIGACFTCGWGSTGLDVTKDTQWTQAQADARLGADIITATKDAADFIGSSWSALSAPRQGAIIDMAYELGRHRLRGFIHLRAALVTGDWQRARDEALNSEWAKQVPNRALQDAEILLDGEWPKDQG